MSDLMLVVVWRVRNPESRQYSWMRTNPQITASRLDYALVSEGLDSNCVNTMYLPGIKTDHRAFYLAIDQIFSQRGPGFWKFNNLLLEDIDFLNKMNSNILENVESSEHLEPIDRWLFIKKQMITLAKSFAKSKAGEKSLIISQLSEQILELENKIVLQQIPREADTALLIQSKQDIEELLEEKARGAMFRAKVRWQEYGERTTKFFFNLEKARYNAKVCNKIIQPDGSLVTDSKEVKELQRNFYQDVYRAEACDQMELVNNTTIHVPKEIVKSHQSPFTIIELTTAIKQLQRHKTPGISGLTADFYKVFHSKFKEILLSAKHAIHDQAHLPKQLRMAVINLILKPKKDSRYLKNLRPISLRNTDYKLIEKMIAN